MKQASILKLTVPSIFLMFCLTGVLCSQQLAFPTAEGYGKYSVGGRGGNVYEVTTLNSSGPGSLGEAIGASGPRTVVFRVSGTIEGNFNIRNDKITIAGQTAPGDGICIKGSLKVSANDVIVRYVRVRPNPAVGEVDAIDGEYHKNIILDHVSASWSSDEVLSLYRNESVTIQWCMIAEACAKFKNGKNTGHRFGGIWGNNYSTYHHNLFAHNDSRNPRWASGSKCNDYRNNVIYNWGYNSCYGGEALEDSDANLSFSTFNMVANYYKAGPATRDNVKRRIAEPGGNDGGVGSWHVADNYVYGFPDVTANNWLGIDGNEYKKLSVPWDAMPIDQDSPEEAYQAVLEHGGCSLPKRDTVDARIIEEVRSGTSTCGNNGIITTPSDVGGWPNLKSEPAPADTDHDGMPDAWETGRGLNPNDRSDGTKDRDGDGYTNVEEYINGLVTSGASQAAAVPSSKKAIVLEEFVFLEGPTRDCHASSLLELSNGDLLCTWFGGTRENHPDVNIWLARKPKGGQWQAPMSVSDGGGKTCFNPVLVQLQGRDIQIYYCNPNIDTGQVITSSDNGHTWSEPRQLPEGFVGPIVNKPVYMDDGAIIAGSSLQGGPGKRIHVERSTDNGKTWTKIGPISDPTHTKYQIIQPTILVHSQQRLQIVARTNEKHKGARLVQTWSQDGGLTWSPVSDATLPNNNSAIDAVTLDDGRHLLVYNHSTREDPVGGRKGRGILTVAVSRDGINWEAAAVLEYRTGSVQYSYPAVIQTKDGLVHVTYSWHRRRIKHVVIDPKKLETYPIVDGQWPKGKIPWVESEA
jgi:predicted neuraminidase/pectate lyase